MKNLVVFSAEDWCSNCKVLKKTMQGIEFNIPVSVVDVDKDPSAAREFAIRGVPTLLLMQDNQVIKRHTGTMSVNQLQEFVK
jgi:thioredoxin-like negative regulator of GroEL